MSELNSNESLVDRLKRGDDEAFRVVFQEWNHRLLRYVSVLVSASDAADVVADAWLQAFRDLRKFQGGEAEFVAWITTIARNRALDHLRKVARRQETELAGAEVTQGITDDPLEALGTREAVRLIGMLPQEQAEAVMLRAVLGLDAKRAGEILGKRPGAVRMAAHRGLRALEEALSPPDETDSDTFSNPSAQPGDGYVG